MDTFGTTLIHVNEFDCPLFYLTNLFRCIVSHSVSQSISIVHECNSSCTYKTIHAAMQVERQMIQSESLTLILNMIIPITCIV